MGQVVDGEEDLGAPLRLEQRVLPERGILVDAVLVGVEEVGIRLGRDRLGHALQCERSELVVVIQQGHERAAGHGQHRVGVGRDAAVAFQKLHAEPAVAGGPFLEQPPVVEIVGSSAGEARLPVGEALGGQRLERAGEKPGLHAVHRDQDADERLRRRGRGTVAADPRVAAALLRNLLRHDPGRVLRRCRRHAAQLFDRSVHVFEVLRRLQPLQPAPRPRRPHLGLHLGDRRAENGHLANGVGEVPADLHGGVS